MLLVIRVNNGIAVSLMMVSSPSMEHTLLGHTVKDREGRGNREQAAQ